MKKKLFYGNCTAIITPFCLDTGKVNYKEFEKLIDYQINNGTQAIVFIGTTGESPTLTKVEKTSIVKFAVNYVNHKIPVIVGAGSNSTSEAIEKTKLYEKLGADALLHVTPYYNKATQEGLIQHYTKIAESTSLPIILYNVPARTGTNITPQTVYKLSYIANIIAIKEASGNINQAMEIKRLCGDNISLYSGDDALTYPMLGIGAEGAISVIGNIEPKLISLMYKFYKSNEFEKSLTLHNALLPLINALFCEVNPIPVKYALSLYGFNSGEPRLPLTKLTYENQKLIKQLVKELNS